MEYHIRVEKCGRRVEQDKVGMFSFLCAQKIKIQGKIIKSLIKNSIFHCHTSEMFLLVLNEV